MNDIEKAIKLCKAEIKFYKNELEQPHMKEHKSTYDAYISGHNEAYANCVNSIESFEFIISVLKEKQQREWIPVSERLPDKTGAYFVTNNTGNVVKVMYVVEQDHPYAGWSVFPWIKVLAWMLPPEPYKEDKP